jgi:hypothetical protein
MAVIACSVDRKGVRILGWRHGHAARRQPNPLAVKVTAPRVSQALALQG